MNTVGFGVAAAMWGKMRKWPGRSDASTVRPEECAQSGET